MTNVSAVERAEFTAVSLIGSKDAVDAGYNDTDLYIRVNEYGDYGGYYRMQAPLAYNTNTTYTNSEGDIWLREYDLSGYPIEPGEEVAVQHHSRQSGDMVYMHGAITKDLGQTRSNRTSHLTGIISGGGPYDIFGGDYGLTVGPLQDVVSNKLSIVSSYRYVKS